jgi:carotenoid phi-ring synthase / carotenoid chi-ring synthase
MLRAAQSLLPQPPGSRRLVPPGTTAVVVGGGIAGIAAASVLCERGVTVSLLERDTQLGGRAAAFEHTLATGERIQMERGFHAFFRQYYNLRALLARIDPTLGMLQPLRDYPILGPGGLSQSFRGLPRRAPFHIMKLVWDSPYLQLSDLARIDKREALAMLTFDERATYQRYDRQSARDYLDSLAFPETARRMLFDVFSHSFFNPESELSAAELLMMFHFYFMANREGLIFDVARQPMSTAFWRPFEARLRQRGASVLTGTPVHAVRREPRGGFRVEHAGGELACDLLVLALDVAGLQQLALQSPTLDEPELRRKVALLRVTRPFAVWRLWLDRSLAPERAPFAGTSGLGWLDNISLYERFQTESAAWSRAHGGSVVELHGYALPESADEATLRGDLMNGLYTVYPEARGAQIVDQHFSLRADCPAFPPGSYPDRPTPATQIPGLALAGDFTRMPFPCALMERAAASGFLAANTLLSRWGVTPEPIRSVDSRGIFARSRLNQETTPCPSPS